MSVKVDESLRGLNNHFAAFGMPNGTCMTARRTPHLGSDCTLSRPKGRRTSLL